MFNMATRVGQYIIYGLLYLVLYHLLGFELTVIFGIGTIIGELHFMQKEKERKEESENSDEFIP